ncbi:uncharacterized protein N7459_007685 [Penicillium hispanicum]|uniref:uncharacterized protein n=1 Tax=Penicillium hispanicum TaxID=1080232 RepID=UPI002542123E|nr:uncharacterized protein N7459_007685 [Penicillium hispanicum]KAJ5578721.1 hypothetical protein N7459_007685 [Penicillium hispanicum]
MKSYYQVVTTPTADTGGTVIALHFPDRRYFFGQLSEGTQRACIERGIRLSHLTDIFVTGRTEWANTGGLIGIVLTLADAIAHSNAAIEKENQKKAERRAILEATSKGKESKPMSVAQDQSLLRLNLNLNIHGTTNLTHSVATARRFVFRKGLPLLTKEYTSESVAKAASVDAEDPFEKPSWQDANIKVWALPIKPDSLNRTTGSSQPRSQSPRKRSLGEFQETEETQSESELYDKDQLMRQSVVTDMFNSKWKMDALVETPLAQVKMPATLFVRNPETKDLEQYRGPKPGDGKPLPKINVLVRQPWPGATVQRLPPTSPSAEALCYVVRNHDIRGKFEPAKAIGLGVPKGPCFAALTRGESVQSEDGKTVTPEMVLGPSRLGKGVAIMDVPSPEYVEGLVNRPEWKSPAVTTELKSFIWILGPGVGDHPRLREFVASMSHCKHTVSSPDYCPNYLAFPSSAASTIRLACLNGDMYPVPVHDNVAPSQREATGEGSAPSGSAPADAIFEPLQPGLIINMEPQFELNRDEVTTPLDTTKTIHRIPRAVEKRMEVTRKRIAKSRFTQELAQIRKNLPGANAEIIALGTGSSAPSKYRNVSGTLLHVPGTGYYLFDCGENTLGQLKRIFEPEQLREVLRNLRMIWISHLHADHHLGTAALIKAWYQENYGVKSKPAAKLELDMGEILKEKRLVVVSDEMMISWLEEYASVEDYGADKLLTLCAFPDSSGSSITTTFTHRHSRHGGPPFGLHAPYRTKLSFTDESSPLTPLLKSATGLDNILTTYVKHCRGSLAVSLVFPDGFKVSYSGDCRPSDKFVSIGHGSTVLIHEATFDKDMVGSAIAKRHSTAGEAIEVGRRMQARSIFLTHFSQRYQKIAHIEQETDKKQDRDVSSKVAPAPEIDPADADIPFDDPEDQPAPPHSAGLLTDDMHFSQSSQPLPHGNAQVPGVNTPIVAAMDYMRIKVGDIAIAQAYSPAFEKLVEVLERASDQVAEAAKQKRQEEEDARKAKKNKKFAQAKAPVAAATIAAVAVASETEEPANPVSVWSASESEEGWETSDYEEES